MARGQLTREQNVKSAVIFLNNFNLKLEEQEGLNKNSRLRILDCIGDPVGELYFDGEYIKLKTLSPFGILNAKYKRSFYNVVFDKSNGAVKYCTWISNINFDIYKHNDEKYKGSFLTDATIDENGKRNIEAQLSIGFMLDDKEVSHVGLMSFGDGNYKMSIEDDIGYDEIYYDHRCISHKRKTNDGGDIETVVVEDDGIIAVINDVSQDENQVFYGNITEEVAEPKIEDKRKQMIRMMSENNPDLKKRVNDIRSFFSANDCDLLNNAIDTCFVTSSNEDVLELLGLSDKKITYQNGSNNLRDAYFGKDSEEFKLSPKMHRKLKKKF